MKKRYNRVGALVQDYFTSTSLDEKGKKKKKKSKNYPVQHGYLEDGAHTERQAPNMSKLDASSVTMMSARVDENSSDPQ
jgi:hypothetical protein